MSALDHLRRILGVRGGSDHHPTPAMQAGVRTFGIGLFPESLRGRLDMFGIVGGNRSSSSWLAEARHELTAALGAIAL
jgi:hypothetical protein